VATPLVAHSWHTASSQIVAEPLLLDGLPLDLHVRTARAPVAEAPLALLLVAGGSALAAWRALRRSRAEASSAV